MKGKNKTQKGITLVALIVTIVILLILAVVTINLITEGDVIKYAESATGTYDTSLKNEQDIINGYVDYLEPCASNGHTYKNGLCTVCGNECAHSLEDGSYESLGNSQHKFTEHCVNCGLDVSAISNCTFSATYGNYYRATHSKTMKCPDCGAQEGEKVTESCTYSNASDYRCDLCNGYNSDRDPNLFDPF